MFNMLMLSFLENIFKICKHSVTQTEKYNFGNDVEIVLEKRKKKVEAKKRYTNT